MKMFDLLFHLLLFLKITSGLKCHECSDLSDGQSCTSLRKFSNKDCDLQISKNERAVCKSSWKGDSLYISECSVASVEDETGCCFKGGPVNNRTICTCDTDFCLDKPQPNSISNRCKKNDVEVERESGLKCFECNNAGGPRCDYHTAIQRDCSLANSPGQRSVCKLLWKGGETYKAECSVAPLKEANGCCIRGGNHISCTCDTDLCVGDTETKKQCEKDDSRNQGLLCYNCADDYCTSLPEASISDCYVPTNPDYKAVCESWFLNKADLHMRCGIEKIEKKPGCCTTDESATECTCDSNLCLHNNKPPTTDVCRGGLKCYNCNLSECKSENLATAPIANCGGPIFKYGPYKAMCISIWEKGVWSSSSCDRAHLDEKPSCCVEEVRGVIQTRCTCDSDLCTTDGSAITEICESSTGLKCYVCNSAECDHLTAKETAFCGPPDTAAGKMSVCKTIWKEGILSAASCASVKIDEKTECCDKSRFSDTEYSCTCTSDLCLGDSSGKPKEQCDPTPRLKCHICKDGKDCNDLASLPKHDCEKPESLAERAVCATIFKPAEGRKTLGCSTVKLETTTECCYDFGDEIACKCTTNLCIGDGKGGNGQSTECPYDGLKCYACYNRDGCMKDLATISIEFCNLRTNPGEIYTSTCVSTWNKDGLDFTRSSCQYGPGNENCCKEQNENINNGGPGFFITNKRCHCNNDLCLGDGTGKTTQRCDPFDPEKQHLKLKCYVCNNAAECANLDKSIPVTCNDRKGFEITGNDELKHTCETKYDEEILQSVQCKTVELNAPTDCCSKDFCTCTKDVCIGDGSGGINGPERPCKCRVCEADVECYICGGDGEPSCGDGNVDEYTPRKVCDPGQVCYSEREHLTGKIKRACYDPKNQRIGRCKVQNVYYCLCDKDLCLGNGKGGDVIVTTLAPGITCYQCDGDCDDLDTINKQVCRINEVCYTVAKDGMITGRGCYPYPFQNDKLNFEIGRCVRTEESDNPYITDTFDDGIACFCNQELCIGDGKEGKEDTGQKPAINYGLRCYTCGNQYHYNAACRSEQSFPSRSKLCPPGEICLSEITDKGIRTRSCSDLPSDITPGKCIPYEGRQGDNVGATCFCDNEDLCIGDGKGNDAQVTKAGDLKCYECDNCDKVNRNTPMVSCPVGHCVKSTNGGIVRRYCGTDGTVGTCDGGICACNDKDGCNGSRLLTASASCSVGVAIFVSYVNLN